MIMTKIKKLVEDSLVYARGVASREGLDEESLSVGWRDGVAAQRDGAWHIMSEKPKVGVPVLLMKRYAHHSAWSFSIAKRMENDEYCDFNTGIAIRTDGFFVKWAKISDLIPLDDLE